MLDGIAAHHLRRTTYGLKLGHLLGFQGKREWTVYTRLPDCMPARLPDAIDELSVSGHEDSSLAMRASTM